MNILDNRLRAVRAWHANEHIHVELSDGRRVRFPVRANERLRQATPRQRNRIEISPFGLHWPGLDEDLSLAGILDGRYGHEHGGPRKNAGRKKTGHVRMQICVSPGVRNRIRALARARRQTLSAVLESHFGDSA